MPEWNQVSGTGVRLKEVLKHTLLDMKRRLGGMQLFQFPGALPRLETRRLILRMLTPEDVRDVFEYASDPRVSEFVAWDAHQSPGDSAAYLQYMLQKYRNREPADWGIVLKESNRLIGTCGFTSICSANASAEIGYSLSPRYWNRGLMSEAVQALISYGFEMMRLNRIEARCMLANIASQRVMEKAGMQHEGILRDHVYAKGRYHSVRLCSILRSEYLARLGKNAYH